MKELLESIPSCCWFGMAFVFMLMLFVKVDADETEQIKKDRNE